MYLRWPEWSSTFAAPCEWERYAGNRRTWNVRADFSPVASRRYDLDRYAYVSDSDSG